MRNLNLVLGLALVVAVANLARLSIRQHAGTAPSVGQVAPVAPVTPVTPPLDETGFPSGEALTLDSVRTVIADRYRIAPDARFLRAIADVPRFFDPVDVPPVSAEFQRDHWEIRCGTERVGALPEFPDFTDALELTTAWADLNARRHPLVAGTAADRSDVSRALDGLDALSAAKLVQKAWRRGERDRELIELGARALTLLAVETTDRVGASDAVAARALSAVSVARALGARSERAACLLAWKMDYAGDALNRARRLDAGDPVRAFVCKQDSVLEEQAKRPDATLDTRFLMLLRLAHRADEEGWWNWTLDYFESSGAGARLAVEASGLLIDRFETHTWSAHRVLSALGSRLPRPWYGRTLLPAFLAGWNRPWVEEGVERIAAKARSADEAFLDRDVEAGHYRALLYSAYHSMGEHYRESLSSIDATEKVAKQLARLPAGPPAEFATWYEHLAESKAGRGNVEDLLGDLKEMRAFGAPLFVATYEQAEAMTPYGRPERRLLAERIAARLDTRPTSLRSWAAIAQENLMALTLAERHYAGHYRLVGEADPASMMWWASYRGDERAIDSLLALRDLDRVSRRLMLENLRNNGTRDTLRLEREFERLVEQAPEDWDSLEDYAMMLRRRGRLAEERDLVARRIARDPPLKGFDEIFAHSRLATIEYRRGRYREGLAALGRFPEGQQFGAMYQKALLLQALGRGAAAEKQARLAYQRYPDLPAAVGLVAEVLWRQRRSAEAAQLIAKYPYMIDSFDWRDDIGEGFVACFRADPPAGGRAIQDLIDALPAHNTPVDQIAIEASHEGFSQLAFEIQSRLRSQGIERGAGLVHAYQYLKRWQDQTRALRWAQALPPGDRLTMAFFGFDSGDYELLWEVAPHRLPRPDDDEFLWLERAAASKLMRGGDPHRAELDQYFRAARDASYANLGRMMLGASGDLAVKDAARDSHHQAEIFFWTGILAESEGRYRDAADWYTAALETHSTRDAEFKWALNRLSVWSGRTRTMDQIARDERQGVPGRS